MLFFLECHCREHSQSDERNSNDPQHFTVLQFVRTYDISLREDNQSDDQHLQALHQER